MTPNSENTSTPSISNRTTSSNKEHTSFEALNQFEYLELYEITLEKLWELYEGPENELRSLLLDKFSKKLSKHETVKSAIDAEEMDENSEPAEKDRSAVEHKIARDRFLAQNPVPKTMVHPEPRSGKRPPTDEISPLVTASEYVHRKKVSVSALRQILIDVEMENRRQTNEMLFPHKRIDLTFLY
ncbi:unnamed protein product [Caenorhabditis brenneri]